MKVTFVCCPKPFNKHFNDIQHNAIQSWKRLSVTRNVVVVGTDEGVEEYAKAHGCVYVPNVKINKWKTPLVNSIFEIGRQHTPENEMLCYINSDIILLDGFSDTVNAWAEQYHSTTKDVLIVGCRWNWHNPSAINFDDPNWKDITVAKAKADGKMHPQSGIDYFLHTKTTYPHIYPFAIGRYFWDWWLVGNCFKRNVMTIDTTATNFIIHQDSPWFQQGKVVRNRRKMYQTQEVKRNHSFDNYGKSIRDGTNWKSYRDPDTGKIGFKTK
jgi:hypothetical protein